MQHRAHALARRAAPRSRPRWCSCLWSGPTSSPAGAWSPACLQVPAVAGRVAAGWLLREGAGGWAFVATSVAMGATVLSLFADLYPRLMVSSTSSAYDLTVQNSASGTYALKVMTVVTAVLFPLVLRLPGLDVLRVPRAGAARQLRAGQTVKPPASGPGQAPSVPARRPPA